MVQQLLEIEVVFSPQARQVKRWTVQVPVGTRVGDVLDLAKIALEIKAYRQELRYGIWNKVVPETTELATGDRLEIYRPLTVDPKVARRERFKQQGAKTAGLFAKRRKGAKAGY